LLLPLLESGVQDQSVIVTVPFFPHRSTSPDCSLILHSFLEVSTFLPPREGFESVFPARDPPPPPRVPSSRRRTPILYSILTVGKFFEWSGKEFLLNLPDLARSHFPPEFACFQKFLA